MNFADLLFIFKWWFTLFLIGLVFLPLTTSIFSNFFDKGYIFSKTLGITIVSYLIFILGIFHFLHFTQINIILSLIFFAAVNIVFNLPFIMQTLKEKWKIFIFEEVIFLLAILFWSYIRSFQPEIHGLEKYMDFGFVNSILRSDYFPPRDMWFTPFYINYYYFGHLITAVLTKLSDIPSSITYNLMLSTIFAMTFIGSFSIGANLLWSNVILKPGRLKDLKGVLRFAQNDRTRIFIGGFLTAFLVSFSGNLHTIYSFFQAYPNENPVPLWQLAFSPDKFPNSYWYPNATRFIYNTIHEFPIYSFVVSDLHGHVLDIPVVLLTIAILLSLIFNFKNKNSFQISNFKLKIILLSFLLAVMYMTNVWDGIIYFLLTIIVFFYLTFQNFPLRREASKLKIFYPWLFKIFILGIAFIIFTLPFNHNFKPFVSGIGILCAPSFLTDIGKVGPFLFEPNHCQKSPLWQLATLYGFFYFWVISFLFLILKKINPKHEAQNPKQGKRFGHLIFKNLNLFRISNFEFRILSPSDIFVLILIAISTLLILVPEFIYAKDIYPAHYRANTMFKLVYQSFIMLSITSGYIIVRIISNLKNQKLKIISFSIPFITLTFILLSLVLIYPYFAINSFYGNLQINKGLEGTSYLNTLYPKDYQAILWINQNIKGQPVILEAQGDSYTDYARVSANTGLPTVLGWTVHEWLWRGTYDIPAPRIAEVQNLYESRDLNLTKNLINKYDISYVFVGDLERQKYPNLAEQKFQELGKIIYESGQTKIYKIK